MPIVVDEAINGRVLEGVSLEKMVCVCGIYSMALSLYLLLSYFSSSSRTFNILERMHLRANQHTVWIPMETLETVELVEDGGRGETVRVMQLSGSVLKLAGCRATLHDRR
jgi:hypothetical protein